MCDANKDVKLSMKVMINKEKTKVLFAESDNHFVDILLSFLTLPLGRIMKVLDNHYGEKPPTIGSLSTLYHSLANLDTAHFVTEDAKKTLLSPASSFEAEYERLKVDITAEYFKCAKCPNSGRQDKKRYETCSDGVFTIHKASFIISDDLHIMPNDTGYLAIISTLGIADADKAEQIKVDLGFNEIMKLLKASLTSPTPLSDVILNKTIQMNTPSVKCQPEQIEISEDNPNSRSLSLKVMIQKSTGKFLYAQAKEEFVEFLFSFLHIPLGGVEHLVAGSACVEAIDNLYRSTREVIDDKYFKLSPDAKKMLMKPYLPRGCVSKNHIFPIKESLANYSWPCAHKFPNGEGSYVEGPRTYEVKDDLTIAPFCFVSILSSLVEQKVVVSDVEELELKIGLKEGLRILKASLTSTSALTDALLTHIPKKQPKTEVSNVIHGSQHSFYARTSLSYK